MRFDIANQLSAAQAFTGATTVSTNSYDIGTYGGNAPDPSIGRMMAVLVLVTVAAGAGSTQTFDVITSSAADLGTAPSKLVTVIALAAALPAGQALVLPIPQGSIAKRYLGYQNGSSGGTTTITCDAYYMPLDEIPKYKSFIKVVDAAV